MNAKQTAPVYEGIVVPILTPFREDQSIDYPVLETMIDWLCASAVSVLFPMGGSGEFALLSQIERMAVIDCMVQVNDRRRLLFAGTGTDNLTDTLELSLYAQKAGVDGVGVVIPTTLPELEQPLYDYFSEIDRTLAIPFMIYDPLGEGPHSPSPALMSRMADNFKNLVAIKYRTLNGERMGLMTAAIGERLSVFSGSETVFLQDLSVGVKGCVGGGANFYPQLMLDLQHAFQRGDLLKARQIQFTILDAINALNNIYWPLSGKLIMQVLGVPYKPVTRRVGPAPDAAAVAALQTYYTKMLLA
jgi:dihydrodipicolinate synthase/N-acetylneuraminate lyase